MAWPVYKDQLVIIGNPISNIAVVTCWTDREKASRLLPMDKIAAVGNLYSPNRGLDYLVANVLAHPHINRLVVTGSDKLNSGEALVCLRKFGFREGKDELGRDCWRVIGCSAGRLSPDFSQEDLDEFCQTIGVVDLRHLAINQIDFNEYDSLELKQGVPTRQPRTVTLQETRANSALPNNRSGSKVVGRTVAESWLKVLEYILRFGIVSNTQYQSTQQESLCLVSVITDEDPHNPGIPDWFPFTKVWFDDYLPTVTGTEPVPEGVSYWYSDRMRVRWGDQIQKVINKLKAQRESRQCVVDLWDSKSDLDSKEPPCLNHLWFRIQSGKLFMGATIRSNDLYRAYPGNAMSLRILQGLVRDGVDPNMPLDDLLINSQSAHIYDDNLGAAQTVLSKHSREVVADDRNIVDPTGIFEITTTQDQIVVKHLTPEGSFLQEFEGRTAMHVYLKLAPFVSITEHALYLGAELQKAETALQLGLEFVQDKPLTFPK